MIFSCVLYQGEDVPEHSKGIFTAEWVDRLYRGVKRNYTKPFKFVVYVDQDYEFNEPVEARKLILPYRNMFSLLEPFRETGDKQVFMGLDTIITGNVDFLDEYSGFWMLQDPWHPRPCSGVMVFDPQPQIWADIEQNHEKYSKEATMFGYPSDMILLNHYTPRVIDGEACGILSYKAHLMNKPGGIGDARIVYFHGESKPHELPGVPWVDKHWGEPLQKKVAYVEKLNNDPANMLLNAKANMERDLPWFAPQNEHNRTAMIVGGGPSLNDTLKLLRTRRNKKTDIFALNGTHDFLLSQNIRSDYLVMLDSRQDNVGFVKRPRKHVKYLIAAQCHPDVFDALEGQDVTLWFAEQAGMMELVEHEKEKPVILVCGGNTVGLKTLSLAYLMGYRRFDVYGFDSCYRDKDNHAYPQPLNDGEEVREIYAGGRKFLAAPWMCKQAEWFQKQAVDLFKRGCDVRVNGDGLISHMIRYSQEVANG